MSSLSHPLTRLQLGYWGRVEVRTQTLGETMWQTHSLGEADQVAQFRGVSWTLSVQPFVEGQVRTRTMSICVL